MSIEVLLVVLAVAFAVICLAIFIGAYRERKAGRHETNDGLGIFDYEVEHNG